MEDRIVAEQEIKLTSYTERREADGEDQGNEDHIILSACVPEAYEAQDGSDPHKEGSHRRKHNTCDNSPLAQIDMTLVGCHFPSDLGGLDKREPPKKTDLGPEPMKARSV